jgi:hypothetical protein
LKRGGRIVGIKGEPAHGTAILIPAMTGSDGGDRIHGRHVRHAEGSDAAAGRGGFSEMSRVTSFPRADVLGDN